LIVAWPTLPGRDGLPFVGVDHRHDVRERKRRGKLGKIRRNRA
jgi:hypothetical protein